MELFKLEAQLRESTGKKASKLLRRNEMVPCNLYGGDNHIQFAAPYNAFRKLVYTDKFIRVDLQINGKSYPALVKDIQFDPVSDRIIHIDFQELVSNKHVAADIPVKLQGFAPGVQEGGLLQLKLRKLTVKGLPNDLPDEVMLDVTDLELGKSISVAEIDIDNCQIMNSETVPVASVVVPRALRGVDDAEEGEEGAVPAEGAEGEAAEGAEGGEGAEAAAE